MVDAKLKGGGKPVENVHNAHERGTQMRRLIDDVAEVVLAFVVGLGLWMSLVEIYITRH
jgi:hypothetical protein